MDARHVQAATEMIWFISLTSDTIHIKTLFLLVWSFILVGRFHLKILQYRYSTQKQKTDKLQYSVWALSLSILIMNLSKRYLHFRTSSSFFVGFRPYIAQSAV